MFAELVPQITYSNNDYPYLGNQRDEQLTETLLRRGYPPQTIVAIHGAWQLRLGEHNYHRLEHMTPTGDPSIAETVAAEIKKKEEEDRRIADEERRRQGEERIAKEQRSQEARRQALRDTEPGCPYPTLKAAYADGWHDLREEEYGGEQLRLKGHHLCRKTKTAVSATEWGRQGYRVLPDQKPHCWLSGRVGNGAKSAEWAVYREDQVRPKRKVTDQHPQVVDVVAAVWTVNRAAKRRRNAAHSCYRSRAHAFAGIHRENKQEYYRLKSQALHYLVAEGRLQVAGYHVFEGGHWAEVLKGEGYTFHRPCQPQEVEAVQLDGIEAKPRDRSEPRVKDAIYTLAEYLNGKPEVDVYEWPAKVRTSRRHYHDLDDGPWERDEESGDPWDDEEDDWDY